MLFLAIFSVILGGCNKAREINFVAEGSESMAQKSMLLNYLKTPVEDNMNMAELITRSYNGDNYESVEEETLKFFEIIKGESANICSIVCIDDGKDKFEIKSDECPNQVFSYCQQARAKIPLNAESDEKFITVALESKSSVLYTIDSYGGTPSTYEYGHYY